MPKLELSLYYNEVHPLTREFIDPSNPTKVTIDLPDSSHRNLYTYIVNSYEEIDTEARKAISSRFVDYDSYDSDSAYLDMLDKVADNFYLERIRVEGARTFSYYAEGSYSDGQLFGDHFDAVSRQEARLQAKWQMVFHSGTSPNPEEDMPSKWADYLFEAIDDMDVANVEPATPTSEEYFAEGKALLDEAKAKGIDLDGLKSLEELLSRHVEANELALNDEIQYLEEVPSFKP